MRRQHVGDRALTLIGGACSLLLFMAFPLGHALCTHCTRPTCPSERRDSIRDGLRRGLWR